ncbi:MAG TPA: ATP-binding protein [Gammaproteobacteria bacterium]|nr:ATP-binding protein [Gammaproteobacteria bacterium]
MKDQLIQLIYQANPWLKNSSIAISNHDYVPRLQTSKLLLPEWDKLWLILVGPRQAGKTTLALHLAQELILQQRFNSLLYLNCDLIDIRNWLTTPLFIQEAIDEFHLEKPIILIDEVQRLENPGLLLKACADLKLNIKMIATGSSQLEMKSKVQEYLTGRHLEVLVLPLSYQEINQIDEKQQLIYGCYPAVVKSSEKTLLLRQIYNDYINKDIIEILKVSKADVMQNLITLIAHSSGQLVNYQQLATDCQVASATIQNYLSILENTYVLARISPFVGNKRKEITSNPIFYFIDNGFRNQSLHNLSQPLETRFDIGLLVQSAVFQELLKFKIQHFYDFAIKFWRTQSGAEVDFVLCHADSVIPIEAKFRHMQAATISKSFRSFIDAYQPKHGFFITKDFNKKIMINQCEVHFIAFSRLLRLFDKLEEIFQNK